MGTFKLIIVAILIALSSYYLGQKMGDKTPYDSEITETPEKPRKSKKEFKEIREPPKPFRPTKGRISKRPSGNRNDRSENMNNGETIPGSSEMLNELSNAKDDVFEDEASEEDDIREERPDFNQPSKKIGSLMDEQDIADIERIEEVMPEEAARMREAFRERMISEREAMDITPEMEAEDDDIAPLSEDELSID